MPSESTYRVLIVDDEPLVRRGIRKCVNWNELGIEMVAEAANGAEALAQFLQDKPDIILLDINMPKMDGLEFANIVKRERPESRIVIITGYNDFEFARTALRIGVDDYVLKPVTRDTVAQIIRDQIAKLEQSTVPAAETTREAESSRQIALLLNSVLRREPRAPEALLSSLDEHNVSRDMQVRFVVVREYLSRCADWQDEQTAELARFAILNIADERLRQNREGLAFATYRNEMAMILGGPEQRAARVLDELRNSIQDLLEIPVEFGVSEQGPILTLPVLADHAREALSYGFVLSDTPYLAYEKVARNKSETLPYPEKEETELLERMFCEEADITLQRIDALFDALSAATIDVRQSRQYLNRFLLTLARTLESISSWAPDPAGGDLRDLADEGTFRAAEDFETLDEARLWMRDYFMRTHAYIRGVSSRSGQIFLSIRSYIQKNYMHSDLNLKRCSEELYLSSSYISSIIRKESGRSFVDYLNDYRIRQAAKLLAVPGARVGDVAEKVGFTHPTYFSTVFRKVLGVSPTQYRGSLTAADET